MQTFFDIYVVADVAESKGVAAKLKAHKDTVASCPIVAARSYLIKAGYLKIDDLRTGKVSFDSLKDPAWIFAAMTLGARILVLDSQD